MVESFERKLVIESGIYWANNVKFHHELPEYGLIVSGEADLIVRDPKGEGLQGIEVKSGHSYYWRKEIFGTSKEPGYPKIEHLLQTCLYLDHFEDVNKWTILYVDRANLARTEHVVELVPATVDVGEQIETKIPIVKSFRNINISKQSQQTDDFVIREEKRFSLWSVYARWIELQRHLAADKIPPRDYELEYSRPTIEQRYQDGELSKTKYEEATKRGKPIGDLNCMYCKFKNICWGNET
jgi:hypothetical protein